MFSKAPRLQRGAEAILSSEVSSLSGSNSARETSGFPELSQSARKRRNSRERRGKGGLSSIGESAAAGILGNGVLEVVVQPSLRVSLESTPARRRQSRVSASMDESTWSASKLLERSKLGFGLIEACTDVDFGF